MCFYYFFVSFEMGTRDYEMESVNKRHFLGTTFKMFWVYNTTSPNIFIIIYSGRFSGGGEGRVGGSLESTSIVPSPWADRTRSRRSTNGGRRRSFLRPAARAPRSPARARVSGPREGLREGRRRAAVTTTALLGCVGWGGWGFAFCHNNLFQNITLPPPTHTPHR